MIAAAIATMATVDAARSTTAFCPTELFKKPTRRAKRPAVPSQRADEDQALA